MRDLIALFAPRCPDRTTLDGLAEMLVDRECWQEAHDLFRRIRLKYLAATRANDKVLEAQYCFEEVCAKTIYNLSGASAPFDADSPYWVVPNALLLARQLKLDDASILRVVAA